MKHLLDHDDSDGNIFTTYEKKSVAERSPRRVLSNIFSLERHRAHALTLTVKNWYFFPKTSTRMISIHQLGRNINANPIPGLG